MSLGIKSGAVYKMGIVHSEFFGALVHHSHKALFTAGNSFSERDAGVVRRGYHRSL